MVSVIGYKVIGDATILELIALSTDKLPVGDEMIQGYRMTNGSTVIIKDKDKDTTSVNFYDEENQEWEKL